MTCYRCQKKGHVAKNCDENIASIHTQEEVVEDNGMRKMFSQMAIKDEDVDDDDFELLFLQMAFHQQEYSGAGDSLNRDCVLVNSCITVNNFRARRKKHLHNS